MKNSATNISKEANRKHIHDILMDERDTVSIDKAISNSKKRWNKKEK